MSEENTVGRQEEQEEKKEITNDDINLMDAEELGEVDISGEAEKEPEKEEEPKEEPEKEERKNKDGEKYQDPLLATKAELTQTQQRIAELEKKNQELIDSQKGSKFNDFNVLDEDEEAILEDENPDKHGAYIEKKKEYEDYQAEVEKTSKKEWEKEQGGVITNFTGELMNLDMKEDGSVKKIMDEIEKDDSEITAKIRKITEYAESNYKPDSKGVFSITQLRNIHRLIYFDEIINNRLTSERGKIIESLQEVDKNGSAFDKIKDGETRSPQGKTLDKYSQDELNMMDQKQLDLLIEQEGIKI